MNFLQWNSLHHAVNSTRDLSSLHVSMRMVRVRDKVFRNSSGFRFNVSFVDCTSVFVISVLEVSLSFTYIL